MSMDKIYFLILNYRTKEETVHCVDTIRKLDTIEHEKRTVIIDNASEDGSFEYLKQLYKEDKDVELYKMKENIGFSKANNYGYNVIRNKKDAAFIIVCNSDIEFCQRDILIRILEEYKRSGFYIAGPCVYCEKDKAKVYRGYQSPAYPYEWKRWYVRSREIFLDIQLKKVQNTGFSIKELMFGGGGKTDRHNYKGDHGNSIFSLQKIAA